MSLELSPMSTGVSIVIFIGIGHFLLSTEKRHEIYFYTGWYFTKGITLVGHYSNKILHIFSMKKNKIEREVHLINKESIFSYNYNSTPSYDTQHRPYSRNDK